MTRVRGGHDEVVTDTSAGKGLVLVVEDDRNIADLVRLYLTARDATEDKIRGLTLGGDDYVTKPFSLEELVARVRSVLRRSGAAAT